MVFAVKENSACEVCYQVRLNYDMRATWVYMYVIVIQEHWQIVQTTSTLTDQLFPVTSHTAVVSAWRYHVRCHGYDHSLSNVKSFRDVKSNLILNIE